MNKPTDNHERGNLFTLLVFVAIVLTMVLNILSAHIRLGDIGIGCHDWPACFGTIGATADERVAKSLAAGGPVLPTSLARTFHRVAATLLAFLIIGITYLALFRRAHVRSGPWLPLLVLGLTVFLSVLGITTPSLLVPAVTLGNVVGGMAMLALLWWIGQRSVVDRIDVAPQWRQLKLWARIGLIALVIQIALGAWTSGNLAGPSCPDLPGCGTDAWSLPALATGLNPVRELAVDINGKVIADSAMQAVQLLHRLGALLVLLVVGVLAIKALRAGRTLKTTAITIGVLLLLQLAFGLTAVLTELPLAMVTAHNATAALLLLSVVNLNHLLTPKS